MLKNSKIFVTGSNGMVGCEIIRNLENSGFKNIIKKSSKELDLKNGIEKTLEWVKSNDYQMFN